MATKSTLSYFRRPHLLFVLLVLGGCSSAGTRRGGAARAADIPAAFGPLYSELDGELAGAEKNARDLPDKGYACPAMAPSLFQASSYFGPAEPGTPRWNSLMTALDGFQALGARAVSVMISFPDLTAEVKDPEPLLKFYATLAAEVRARKMKLLVEHFIYPPSTPTKEGRFVAGIKNLTDPKAAFFDLKEREVLLIATRIKPDYLTVVTEPETCNRFLGLDITAGEYSKWLDGLVLELAMPGMKDGVKVGAGAGVWESGPYISEFSEIEGLDYIDLHFYPLKLGAEEMFPKFLKLAAMVKAAAPAKELVISETWLYKHGAAEAKGVFDTEAYGRNAYDFWSPLDVRFLELMNTAGRKAGVSVIAPYFPQFFFAAQPYDPAVSPAWPGVMQVEWTRALKAESEHSLTLTGQALKDSQGRCEK